MNLKKTGTIYLISTILVFSQFTRVKPVFAQSLGLSINPPIVEAVIKPNKSITQVFAIQNLSDLDLNLTAKIVPFVPGDEFGNPQLKLESTPDWIKDFTLANTFIKLNEPFVLKANSSDQIVLNISIPKDEVSRDIYATLILSNNQITNNQEGTNLTAAIGANIILTVSSIANPPTLVQIKDFSPIPHDYFFQFGDYYFVDNIRPITFQAKAENLGKFTTKAGGIITIEKNEKPVETKALIPINLLANSIRVLQGSPSGEISYNPKVTDFGKFKIKLSIKSDNSNSTTAINLYFVPLRIVIGIIIGLFLIFGIFRFKNQTQIDK